MSFTINIDVQGVKEAEKKIKSILSSMDSKDVENVMLQGARVIRGNTRKRATGSVKKAIRAKKGKQRGNMYRSAFAAVDRKKAPHAHLVNAGTGPRYHRSGKYTGVMPAKPFWQPGVQESIGAVEKIVNEGLAKLVRRAVR